MAATCESEVLMYSTPFYHQWGGFPCPRFQMVCFRDFFFDGLPCPRSLQAIEVAAANLGERQVLRARLVASVAQPFRRRVPDLLRLSMRGTPDTSSRIRGPSRLHGSPHPSQERRCDQSRPGFQNFSPGPQGVRCHSP
jgi:hypothetical protein